MGAFIDRAGEYFEGDELQGATVVPKRPGPDFDWNGSTWVKNDRRTAQAVIDALEREQSQRLTARAQREFWLGVFQVLGAMPGQSALLQQPGYVALKALDDQIKAERAKL